MGALSEDPPGWATAELELQVQVLQQEAELAALQQEVDRALVDIEEWHAHRDERRREYCAQLEEEYGFSVDGAGAVLGQTLLEGLHDAGLLSAALAESESESEWEPSGVGVPASAEALAEDAALLAAALAPGPRIERLDADEEAARLAALRHEVAVLRAQEEEWEARALAARDDRRLLGSTGVSTASYEGGPEPWEMLSAAEMEDLERRIAEVRAQCEQLAQHELRERVEAASKAAAEVLAEVGHLGPEASESELGATALLDACEKLQCSMRSTTLLVSAPASPEPKELRPEASLDESLEKLPFPLPAPAVVATKASPVRLSAASTAPPSGELSQTQELDALLKDMECIDT